jgi:ABC-type antimicrobial peptide transport system permease subunit
MATGRGFLRQFGSDSAKIIFNQAAIDAMGLKDPVGKTISLWGTPHQIIGVARNFHFESLHEEVKPCFFLLASNSDKDNIVAKIRAGAAGTTIGSIRKLCQEYNPGLAFEYTFLDEDYQALYASDERVAILCRYFAGMAIIISCLGLFGLAAFTAQKRQKEIGIRKVVGATVNNLILLLSKDFLKLVLIAVLVAFPLAWWAMDQWLNSFAYRTPVGILVFLVAGASILLITLLTICFQSVRAALANPVKSLRSE